MIIRNNDFLEPVTETSPVTALVRVIWLDNMYDSVYLIDMVGPPRFPFIVGLNQLREAILSGDTKVAHVQTPEYLLVTDDMLSEKQKADRDTKWDMISSLVASEIPGQIFLPGEMSQMVAARALELGLHRKQIHRVLCKYWRNGQVRNSLLKDYTNVGKSPRVYNPETPPGRPASYQGVELDRAKMLEATDKACIKIGYELYVDDEVSTISHAYGQMLKKFYSEKDLSKNPEAGLRLLPATKIPSLRQFDYWGKKFFDIVSTERGRLGERKWLKDRRPLNGTVRDKLRGPCHQFEIDATIADIYLVNSYSRHMLIGRPVIYVVIDSFSGMIVGVYVGLEGPSWNGARQALFNAFTSKQEFCALNNVIIEPEDWPCHHLPQEVFADRGEMLGSAAEVLATGLGIELGIAPPYRPDWKSMVESRFSVLNSLTGIRWLPGGVAARQKERGERDYRLDATLNMKEFTKIIIKSVLHYNSFHRQPDRLTEKMVSDDVSPTPLSIWNWALENGYVEPNYRPDDLIYLHLLPTDNGTVQKSGVLFKGMYYISEVLIDQNWLAKARSRGVWSVQCWYDPNSADHIWIQANDKKFIRCNLRYSDRKYASYRTDEIYDILEAYRQTPPTHKRAELESRVSLSDEIDSVVNTALKEKRESTQPKTKAARIGNIRENRADERALERASAQAPEGVRSTPSGSPLPLPRSQTEHFAGAYSAQIIDMLKRIRPGQKT